MDATQMVVAGTTPRGEGDGPLARRRAHRRTSSLTERRLKHATLTAASFPGCFPEGQPL